VTRVESEQARAPVGRECGRKFPALGISELKERSPTVFNMKSGTAKIGVSKDPSKKTGIKSFNSSAS